MLVLRKTFCEMGNIPINVFGNPHFINRVKLLNTLYDTDRLWTEFIKATDYYKTSKDYTNHVNSITTQINSLISQRLTPKLIENATRNIDVNTFRRDIDIYKKENIGKKYARIYLCDKYFSALSWVSSSIVDNAKTYETFIRKYTDDRNIICNFDVQGKILGADTNPGLRYALDALTIDMLVKAVSKCFALRYMQKVADGEIIIELAQNQGVISYKGLSEELTNWGKLNRINFELEVFTLGYLNGLDTFVKKFETGRIGKDNIAIVNPDPSTIAIAIKTLEGLPIQEPDKYFSYNGHLSKFLDVPNVEVTYGTNNLERRAVTQMPRQTTA